MSDITELKTFYKFDEYYQIMRLTPAQVRMAIDNQEDYLDKIVLHEATIRDDHYLSKKQDRDSVFSKAEWGIETSGDERIDEFVREILWQVLNNDLLKSIHEAIYQGYSVTEIIWQNNKPVSLIPHNQKSFNFQKGVLKIYDRDNRTYHEIPENKVIKCLAPLMTNGLPVGLSEILAPAITLKTLNLYKDWAHFNEFVSMPMLWAFYADDSQKESVINAIKNLSKASMGAMKKGSEIQFIEAKNNDPQAFEKIIKVCDSAISKAVVGQTLTTETSGSGSYALGSVQSGIRDDLLIQSIETVCNAINRDLITPLINFNFTKKLYPTFNLKLPASLEKKAEQDKKLYDIGVRFTPQYFINNYGLSEDDFKVIEDQQNQPLENSEGKKKSPYTFI